ncbi:MAG TPA: RNA polymerase sporulation sigma factor SigK [Bacillota bacterium]|nr:RNA polymerase sporulation sigma factor SigK [Bacillota bacterium]HOK68306.1 RNA polymerase sporulation sigma factor SigK [Bacillota bacterium]HPP84520.1 RNA polymerase sporulation sigma factor SigK [Bacillota bacterium]
MLSFLVTFLSRFIYMFLKTSNAYAFPPPLPKEEEQRLFRLCRQGDMEARSKLIEHNLRLVAHIVKKYYTTHKEQDDLISIGTIGLIKAIDSFDVSNGARFATYAGKCLQNEILMYFRSQKKHANETSINEAVDIDKDGNPLTYMDIIACDDDIVEMIDVKIKSTLIYKAIQNSLNEREKSIILLRYGLCSSGRTFAQREVAALLGISRSYVSRLEKGALEKIKKYMKENGG